MFAVEFFRNVTSKKLPGEADDTGTKLRSGADADSGTKLRPNETHAGTTVRPAESQDGTALHLVESHDGTTLRPVETGVGTTLRTPGTISRPTRDAGTGVGARQAQPPDSTLHRGLSSAASPPPPGVIAEGTVVQRRFVLEQIVGSGSMGQVWLARDLIREQARNARPHVAIKLLNADVAQHPDAFIGLEREASKAQDLAHPNIITVHNFDLDAALGRAFISMEYLEGDSLEKLIQRTGRVGLTREEALPIVEGMCEGLGYAHKKNVVHCDLKPGNVFVTSQGVPKILDFGIARAARGTAEADQGGFQGYTPAYASPQLIRQEDPVPADDIYSLGVLLYELLTGRHPFAGVSADAAELKGLKPAPIKGLKAREWQAIDRALSFDRSRRWVDATAFRRAFLGTSLVPKVLAAAVIVLGLALCVFAYQSWREAQPDVPFEQLPQAAQQSFLNEMQEGDRAWELVAAGQTFLINDALAHYGAAFDLHPKDHRAVAGLSRATDYVIGKLEGTSDPQAAAAQLQDLQQKNTYLDSYQPLRAAIDRLKSHQGGSSTTESMQR
jgi:hypothetical protein